MVQWVKFRDVGGYEIWEQRAERWSTPCYRITSGDGRHVIVEGVSIGWHHLVHEMTVRDIQVASQLAYSVREWIGGRRTEIIQAMIERAVSERRNGYEVGMQDGIDRERRESVEAASDDVRLLKHHVCEILGAEPADDPECPALAGWIRGTKRRATKGVFVTLGPLDQPFRKRIHEAMERAGHDPRGTRDGVGRQVPHAIVVAPRREPGRFRGIGKDEALIRHDVFVEAIGRAGLEMTESGLSPALPMQDVSGIGP